MYETDYNSGEYQTSNDTNWPSEGYEFNETLSKCENGSSLTWDDENQKVLMQANKSDKCYIYFDKELVNFAIYIINNVYTGTDGDNGLYYHDGQGTYGTQETGDNSYRFAGANPNNYVCFGSDEASCSENNLYRIIGVFDGQVKLIKHTVLGSGNWSGGKSWTFSGNWSDSNLNTVNLNTNYLNNIGSTWSSKIANHIWRVGGNTSTNIMYTSPTNAYINEIVTPPETTTYTAKIGLMYVSDYYYGAHPKYWTYHGYTDSIYPNEKGQYGEEYDYRAAINDNWMYMGMREWTITSNGSGEAFYHMSDGGVSYEMKIIAVNDEYYYRPVFYLIPDVKYISGTGTQTDPYHIA